MSHRPTFANHLKSLGRTVFWDNRIDGICPENPCQQLCFSVRRFLPTELSPSYFPRFPLRPPLSSLPPCSFPTELSPSYFPRFPLRPPYRRFRLAPSQRSSPQAISHGFPSVHPIVASALLLPSGTLPKLFPRFPLRPPCRRFHQAPSPWSSPQAISHGFPSVHPVVASISLLPTELSPSYISHGFPSVHPLVASTSLLSNEPLPKLLPTVSGPSTLSPLQFSIAPSQRRYPQAISTLSSLPYRCFPKELSPKLFPTVSLPSTLSSLPYMELSPCYFPRFPFRPPCRHSRIAPCPRRSPQTISNSFPSVHPIVASVSLLTNRTLPKLFPTVSLPSTLSSLPYRSFPTELSPSYSQQFPLRPPSRRFRIAPAISHGFPSVHLVVTSVSLLRHGALPKLVPTVSFRSALSLLPYRSFQTELSLCYFPRLPFRPPCRHSRIAPYPRSCHKLFPTVSPPFTLSSLQYRSFATELSPRYISHGFPSVHPAVASVSLFPNGAPPMLFPTVSLPSTLSSLLYRSLPTEPSPSYFPRFPLRSPYRRFSTFAMSSLPSRSFPTELSPSYFHGFLSVHPVVTPVSLLAHGALPKLFPTVSPPSTLSSLQYRPNAHCFPSVHLVVTPVSLLLTEALPMLFPTISFPSNGALPNPQAISHGFPSVQPCRRFHLAPSPRSSPELFPTVSSSSTQSSLPSVPFQRSSPQAISHGFPSVLSSLPYRSLAATVTKREPKHRRCFWEKCLLSG